MVYRGCGAWPRRGGDNLRSLQPWRAATGGHEQGRLLGSRPGVQTARWVQRARVTPAGEGPRAAAGSWNNGTRPAPKAAGARWGAARARARARAWGCGPGLLMRCARRKARVGALALDGRWARRRGRGRLTAGGPRGRPEACSAVRGVYKCPPARVPAVLQTARECWPVSWAGDLASALGTGAAGGRRGAGPAAARQCLGCSYSVSWRRVHFVPQKRGQVLGSRRAPGAVVLKHLRRPSARASGAPAGGRRRPPVTKCLWGPRQAAGRSQGL